jgi:type II secretory pathway pseudopilin PulG
MMRNSAGHRYAIATARSSDVAYRGFSLIEVIMATAILMGSAVVLGKLAGMGREQSSKARLHSEAQQNCEQTLHELLLGLRPLETTESTALLPLLPTTSDSQASKAADASPAADLLTSESDGQAGQTLEETAEWLHSIRMAPLTNQPGMWSLTIEVVQSDLQLKRPVRFSLTRWISGPPTPDAFDGLMQGFDEATSFPAAGAPL